MRSTTPSSNHLQSGFTLVEVLIIAPIALLIISGFIALMVTLTGDVLASSARTTLIERTDFALERFEQDARFAKEFRETSFTPLYTQQGRKSEASTTTPIQPFDVKDYRPPTDESYYGTVRILRSYATSKNPLDPTKSLIYSTTGPGNCADDTKIRNDPYEYDIIYYVKKSSGSAAENNLRYSMWRRIIFNPSQTPCAGQTIWQKSTCAPGTTGTPCQTEDEKIIDNLVPDGFGGYYANQPDQSATLGRPDCIRSCPNGLTDSNALFPTSTDGVSASSSYFFLSTKLTVAGRDAEYSAGVYARRSN